MDGKLKAILILWLLLYPFLNGYGQDCDIPGNGSFIYPKKGCAPLLVTYKVELQGIAGGASADVLIQFDWDDGSPIEYGTPTYDAATDMWSATLTHSYDIRSQQCIYEATGTPIINGTICDGSTAVQRQNVTVWDSDYYSSTGLVVAPQEYNICYGNTGGVIFEDVSIWNCEPPELPIEEGPNSKKRWIQWIYGRNHANADFIDDIWVGGSTPATFPYDGPIEETFEPIFNPEPPWSQSEDIQVVSIHDVGKRFQVTLRNWNQCNPYDDPSIPGPPADAENGDNDPVEIDAWVVIVAPPDGSVASAGPFCEYDDPVTLTPITPGGTWSGPGIVDATTGEFDPSIAGPGTHRIDYVVTDANNCSASGYTEIEVFDSPLADILTGPEAHLCPGSKLTLDGNPTQGQLPYTHLWTGDVAYLSATDVVDPVFESPIEGNFELVYRVSDFKGCFDEDTVIIDVDSISIDFLNKEQIVCTDDIATLEPNPSGGSGVFVNHLWTGDDIGLLSDDDIENPNFLSTNPGLFKYEYSVIDSYGCENSDSIYVKVYEQPISNAGTDDNACGLSYQLNAIPSVGIGTWTLASGPGTAAFSDANDPLSSVLVDMYGNYVFTWTEDNNSCSDASSINITFTEVPYPQVIDDADTCGISFPLEATTSVGTGAWELISGAGTANFDDENASNTIVTISNSGIYEFAWVENNSGCIAGDTVEIEFYPVPNANVEPFDDENCSPLEIVFENTSTDADTYFWDFGDGFISNQENPTHSFVNNTTAPVDYEIELVASNSYSCVDTSTYPIRVLPTAIAQFENDEEPGCSPLEIEFTNKSVGATAYEWDFGDGEISNDINVIHTFINQEHYVQAYKVELVANNAYNCRDTAETYITVYPLVEYPFTTTPPEGCSPLKVEMVAEPGAYTYKWNFGDGNSIDGANIATHIFENTTNTPQDYLIKLYTSSIFGCNDTSEMTVNVLPSPISAFELSEPEGCSPFVVDIYNQSIGASKSTWYFDDGNEFSENGANDITHTYHNTELATISYQPKLIVENTYGCKDSTHQYLRVFPKVTASISDGGAGCTPHLESLLNNSIGANEFLWDFGDGNTSTSFNGHNQYINNTFEDQNYEVQLIAKSNYECSDTTHTNVTVYRRPQPNFTASPAVVNMPDATVNIVNNTQGYDWSYLWKFGDGNESTQKDPGSYTYGSSGDYDLWLVVNGEHCNDSLRQTVEVLPTIPIIDYGPDSQGCPPLEVQFYNNTVDATVFLWDFGDGNISSEKEPKHIYYTSGKYNVSLTAEGPGGIDESSDVVVEVYDKPFADFEVRPTVVKLPETVSFINQSEGGDTYLWDFGDGQTSTEYSVQYLYEEEGIYDVKLEVTNDKGCIDERIIREAVIAEAGGKIRFPNAFTPNPSGSSGGHYTPGSSDNFVFYPFVHEGVVEYQLRIYTRWGELIFESNDLNIGWDGYYKDKICALGVYIWKVRCRYSNGEIEVLTGDVTLFR